jgi:hypothetical protein
MGWAMRAVGAGLFAALAWALAVALAPAAQSQEKPDFVQQILTIDREYAEELRGSIFGEELLLVTPHFEALAASGEDYLGDCLAFLSEATHTTQQRRIAILAMHKLTVRSYVSFANGVLDLYDRGLTSIDEVDRAVLSSSAFTNVEVKNFLDSDVRAVLRRAQRIPDLYEVDKSFITYDLLGINYFYLWLHRDARPKF